MSNRNFSARFLQTTAAGRRPARRSASAGVSRAFAGGSHGRHRLCRGARRFRLEPGACGRRQALKDVSRRQGRRRRERAGDRRLRQIDGIDDQPRRRRADPRDLVRLLHAVRRRPRQEISQCRVPPRRAAVEQGQGPEERRQLFRLSQPGRITSTASRRVFRRKSTSSASSRPSRSPACSATSTRSCSARAGSTRTRTCR